MSKRKNRQESRRRLRRALNRTHEAIKGFCARRIYRSGWGEGRLIKRNFFGHTEAAKD